MGQIRKIEIEKVSYDTYKQWLEEIGYKKKLMLKADQDRLKINAKIRDLREEMKNLNQEAEKLAQKVEEIRAELIEAIPAPF